MKVLDLHGTYHMDAENKIMDFLETVINRNEIIKIITGNSIVMRGIVLDILKEYDIDIPSQLTDTEIVFYTRE